MKVKYLLWLIILSLFFFFPTFSRAITLEEAIDIALKNNSRVLLAREKVKEAEQKIKEVVAGYLPSLSLSGTYTHLGEVPSMSIPALGEVPMGEQDTTSFVFTLTQPLYTSGQLSLANKQARLSFTIATQELNQTQREVVYQAKESFYSALLAMENLETAEKALNQAKAHLEVVESFYRSGRVSRFDLLRAKVEVANLRPEVIRARNNLNLAKERLASILSLPSLSLEIEGKLEFKPLTITLDEAIKTAFVARNDLKSLEIQKDIAEVSLQIARVKNYPSLSFVGNYEFTYPGEEDEWDRSWNINLVLSFPFFDSGKNKALVEQAKSRLRQLELSISQLKDAIELEVKKAFWDMQTAKEVFFAQKKNVEQAEEALSIAEGRYKSGTITQIEVLDASLALTQARLACSRALYEYNLATAALIKAMGKIEG